MSYILAKWGAFQKIFWIFLNNLHQVKAESQAWEIALSEGKANKLYASPALSEVHDKRKWDSVKYMYMIMNSYAHIILQKYY